MMTHLSLSLLGPFQVALAGEPVTGFESNKVRALLAYLAVEADQPHRRQVLAGLLWPDWPDRAAHSNLRHALANLRKAIDDHHAAPPFLLITRETIQFNTASDCWLDVAAFGALTSAEHTDQPTGHRLEEAIALYQGSFLEGFSLRDSPAFEDWALLVRERLQRQVLTALYQLAEHYQKQSEYERACDCARRQVELEPWHEEAHQQLMRLLALSGQRSAALAQYETCRRRLAEELGIEPAPETTRLYKQIRNSKLQVLAPYPTHPLERTVKFPAFLEKEPAQIERPVFVARERELARLDKLLDLALAGQSQVAFVIGEAGSGKTALMQEFAQRAQETHDDLVLAGGDCNAYTGIGDPYLPFREILELLTGDIEAEWTAGAIVREHARRLWALIPHSVQALLDAAPDLIDVFVPGPALVKRAATAAPDGDGWLTQLDELVTRKKTGQVSTRQQSALFEQYTRVLQTLARWKPLLLALDDLQWADAGSIGLLFHLGRRLKGNRILLVGLYRPDDVAVGRRSPSSGQMERHPLESVINELQRRFGDIQVNLGQSEDREFVEALLDTEPNCLGLAFREALYQHSKGNPLFTIETLRGMQERGDLIQNEVGQWVEGPTLDWKTLPARVEGVIGERIGRLPTAMREVLKVASVEGEVFTAQVVAQIQATNEREMVSWLSGQLDRQHRLVTAQGSQRLGKRHLSRYRFRHILFEKYLYSSLDAVERAYLHQAVGNALETLHEAQPEAIAEIAGQLARHFQEAGAIAKAIDYLLQAGSRAIRLSANQEAMAHLTKGLGLLQNLPQTAERQQLELELQLGLGVPLQAVKGYASPEVQQTYARARELCHQIGETPQLFPALHRLCVFHMIRADLQIAYELAEQLLALAQRTQTPNLLLEAYRMLGQISYYRGELVPARKYLEQVTAAYNSQQHRNHTFLYSTDLGVVGLSAASQALVILGYPDQAQNKSQQALALAQELPKSFTQAYALGMAAAVPLNLRQAQAGQELAEATIALATEQDFPHWLAYGNIMLGSALAEQGRAEEGIAYIREGLNAYQAVGSGLAQTVYLCALAEACRKIGYFEEGLKALKEALTTVEETNERFWEADLHRLKGDILLLQGAAEAQAEACFHQALEIARRQSAKWWELRAAKSLSRLWHRRDKKKEARQMLAEVYNWFTEGLNTIDLQEAKALLKVLEHN